MDSPLWIKVDLTAGTDFTSTEDGSVQLLPEIALNDLGGLLLEFSFTQSLDNADNVLYFVIQPSWHFASLPFKRRLAGSAGWAAAGQLRFQ